MLFSSLIFLFAFLPLTLLFYYLTPGKYKNLTLLGCSLVFYAWGEVRWFPVLVGSVTLNFLAGRALRSRRWRGLTLGASIAVNLGLLAYFKYGGPFLEDSIFLPLLGGHTIFEPYLRVSMPLGISFFTFQCISYLVDVYQEKMPPAESFSQFFLFVGMFPHLIAGPIVRFRDVREELAHRSHRWSVFSEGIGRIILGLGKKVLIADSIGPVADYVFGLAPNLRSPSLAWCGVIAYGLQIFFDFSGYSDIAIGLARLFGIHYKENFNYPYAAKSITDFWRRWHISLSLWFRDYLYIPLGGNRKGRLITSCNLLLVFLLCGLWHGPNWTFVVWGLMHGFFLMVERLGWGRVLERIGIGARIYSVLVIFLCWVPFRAVSLEAAGDYYQALFGLTPASGQLYRIGPFLNAQTLCVAILALILSLLDWGEIRNRWGARLAGSSGWTGGLCSLVQLALLLVAIARLASNSYNPFIYFRF
jgi:alginate O-acetyltransferase complex protein AlgI